MMEINKIISIITHSLDLELIQKDEEFKFGE